MKKFLLGTTALVGFAASTAAVAGGSHYAAPASAGTAAAAGGLTVMIGGYVDSQAGFSDQEEAATPSGASTREAHINTESEIHITAAGSTEDFDYGAVVELEATINGDPETGDGDSDKTYIFLEGDDFGRFELGNNSASSHTMEIDASNIARATGGIEGDWWRYVGTNGSTIGQGVGGYTVQPNLFFGNDGAFSAANTDRTAGADGDAGKVTYYTPNFSGFQLGVSYIPDSGNVGYLTTGNTAVNAGQFEDVWTAGLSYNADLDGVGLGLSAVGELGDSEGAGTEDLEAYSIGAQLDFGSVSIAGGYGDKGDSGQAAGASQDNTYWTAGAAFENGPYGLSLTYIDSETPNGVSQLEVESFVVGADYQMAPGFTPYVEAAFFEFDDNIAGNTDNEGSVVLLGAELSF